MIIQGHAPYIFYVPSWEGNDALPEEEKIKCKIKVPTVDLYSVFSRFFTDKKKSWREIDVNAIMAQVVEVEGLTVSIEGVETAIKTGAEMMKQPQLMTLVDEIAAYILDMFQKKNMKI